MALWAAEAPTSPKKDSKKVSENRKLPFKKSNKTHQVDRSQRRVRSFCPRQNAKLTSCLYAMTTALRNQAFMTKVTTTCRGALHSLNAMPLRGEGDPGEPYPLNNSPFPNGPGSHYLRKVVFSLVFSAIFSENVSFTIAPEVRP